MHYLSNHSKVEGVHLSALPKDTISELSPQWRGNYFRTGGARTRALKFFAEIGVFFIPKTSVLLKQRSWPDWGCLFCTKNKRSQKK